MSKLVARICVFGGRDFCKKNPDEYEETWILHAFKLITRTMSNLIKDPNIEIIVVDGVAAGADTVGYRWGQSQGFTPERYPAKWKDDDGNFDRTAGFTRNSILVDTSDYFIGFWDGESKGSNDTRKKVIKAGKPLRMFKYNPEDHSETQRIKEWEQ